MKVHFLKVGDGDSTIVELPDGNIMMVDIMNGRNDYSYNTELENPINYLKQLTSSRSIYRYIQTHPDMDHLDGFKDLIDVFSISNFWDTANTKKKPEDFSNGFRETDWNSYKTSAKGRELKILRRTDPIISDSGPYIYEIYPIAPTQEFIDSANSAEDWNSLSYIALLVYQGFKILFGGDATTAVWEDVYKWINSDSKAKNLLSDVTIFKTSHHGRKSGYCGSEILKILNPQNIISDDSVPGDESANQNYDYFMTNRSPKGTVYSVSQNTIIAHYYDYANRNYSINYKN